MNIPVSRPTQPVSVVASPDIHNVKQYYTSDIPESFLNDEQASVRIQDAIDRIELYLSEKKEVDNAYKTLLELLEEEMSLKLREKKSTYKRPKGQRSMY